MRDLIVTPKGIFLIGRQLEKSGPNKGQEIETISRKIEFSQLYQVRDHPILNDLMGFLEIFKPAPPPRPS